MPINEATFKVRLQELIKEIESLPDPDSRFSKDPKTVAHTGPQQLAATAKTVDEALDYLRLQIKYVLFDLEATRRENRYLRKMLENRPPNGSNGPG